MMPLVNWDQMHETGDLRHLLVEYNEEYQPTEEDLQHWFVLQDQKIAEFDHSDDFKKLWSIKKRYAKKLLKVLSSGKRSQANAVVLVRGELEAFYKSRNGMKARQILAKLQQKIPVLLDMKTITVWNYYNYLDSIDLRNG